MTCRNMYCPSRSTMRSRAVCGPPRHVVLGADLPQQLRTDDVQPPGGQGVLDTELGPDQVEHRPDLLKRHPGAAQRREEYALGEAAERDRRAATPVRRQAGHQRVSNVVPAPTPGSEELLAGATTESSRGAVALLEHPVQRLQPAHRVHHPDHLVVDRCDVGHPQALGDGDDHRVDVADRCRHQAIGQLDGATAILRYGVDDVEVAALVEHGVQEPDLGCRARGTLLRRKLQVSPRTGSGTRSRPGHSVRRRTQRWCCDSFLLKVAMSGPESQSNRVMRYGGPRRSPRPCAGR